MVIYLVTNLKELEDLLKRGYIGKGTFSTGKFGLEQGKPVFVTFPEGGN
jgi:hypothetical protein